MIIVINTVVFKISLIVVLFWSNKSVFIWQGLCPNCQILVGIRPMKVNSLIACLYLRGFEWKCSFIFRIELIIAQDGISYSKCILNASFYLCCASFRVFKILFIIKQFLFVSFAVLAIFQHGVGLPVDNYSLIYRILQKTGLYYFSGLLFTYTYLMLDIQS